MTDDHHERFEADKGYRLFRRNCSVLLHSLGAGKVLSTKEKSAAAKAILDYWQSIGGRISSKRASTKALTLMDFCELRSPSFYRFVTPEIAKYIERGSFRLGSLAFYRTIEDTGRSDPLEGYS